jgi:hypothetical protein
LGEHGSLRLIWSEIFCGNMKDCEPTVITVSFTITRFQAEQQWWLTSVSRSFGRFKMKAK